MIFGARNLSRATWWTFFVSNRPGPGEPRAGTCVEIRLQTKKACKNM